MAIVAFLYIQHAAGLCGNKQVIDLFVWEGHVSVLAAVVSHACVQVNSAQAVAKGRLEHVHGAEGAFVVNAPRWKCRIEAGKLGILRHTATIAGVCDVPPKLRHCVGFDAQLPHDGCEGLELLVQKICVQQFRAAPPICKKHAATVVILKGLDLFKKAKGM